MRGLEKIFSPVVVNAMSDKEVEAIASEPLSAKRQREMENCIKKLQSRHQIFNNNLRFLNNVPHNANVVDFADLGRSPSSSGATCF